MRDSILIDPSRKGNASEAQTLIDMAVSHGVDHHTSWYTNLASAHAVDKNFDKALLTLNTMKDLKGQISVPSFPSLIKSLGTPPLTSSLIFILDFILFYFIYFGHLLFRVLPRVLATTALSSPSPPLPSSPLLPLLSSSPPLPLSSPLLFSFSFFHSGSSRAGLAWCLSEFMRIVATHVEVPSKVYSSLISQFGKAGNIQVYGERGGERRREGERGGERGREGKKG